MRAPAPDEQAAIARFRDAGAVIVAGVQERLAGYLVHAAGRVLDAWRRVDEGRRGALDEDLRAAASTATTRVVEELHALFALDPADQIATPLEIVRSSYREPTAVLRDARVGAVVRDAFEERAWPEDRYGLVPRTFAALADGEDDQIGPAHLAWGMAKAGVLRARGSPK